MTYHDQKNGEHMTQGKNRKRTSTRPGMAGIGNGRERDFKVFQEAFDRWEGMPPVTIAMEMPRCLVFSLIGALQIVARQETTNPRMRRMVTEIGRGLQGQVCDVPELYLIVDVGWPPKKP